MNRKIYLIGMMALAMLFASCKKEEKPEIQEEFSIMAVTENDGSKTYLEGNLVKWIVDGQNPQNSDVIKVFDRTGNAVDFKCSSIIGDNPQAADYGTNANFTSTTAIDDQGEYWAFYPATQNVNPSRNGNTFTFTMPATQTYKNGTSFANNLFPMAAHFPSGAKSGVKLQFKNAFGILRVRATGNTPITAIRVTDNNRALWGTFSFNIDDRNDDSENWGVSAADNSINHTITLNINNEPLSSQAKDFYIILPPGSLEGNFTVEFLNGNVVVKSASASGQKICRNTMKTATASVIRTFSFKVDDNGTMVQFAPGNLQYQASTNTWRFAENTWDFIDGIEVKWGTNGWTIDHNFYEKTGNNNPASSFRQDKLYYPNNNEVPFDYIRDNQPDWIDLFGWGTSNAVDAATQGDQFDEPWHWVGGGIGGSNYHFKYGPASGNLAGTNWDWSVNTISNSTETGWRTLTNSEWSYLVNSSAKYGFAELLFKPYQGIYVRPTYLSGIVLLPDGFVDPYSQGASENQPFTNAANSTGPNSDFDAFDNNKFTETGWEKMEKAGAVFLPCAGVRGNLGVSNASSQYHGGKKGLYWSSTVYNSDKAYSFMFQNSLTAGSSSDDRSAGASVRLVREVSNTY